MLIDDLRALDIQTEGLKIRDAIVFRINELSDDFEEQQIKHNLDPLPSLLPYDNIVIHFNNLLLWFTSEEQLDGRVLIACNIFLGRIDYYSKNNNKLPFVYMVWVDRKTFAFSGMNVYYPQEQRWEFLKEGRSPNTPFSSMSNDYLKLAILANYKMLRAFLNILSCKNIKTELETPDEKIQKKRAAKGKLPLVSFYTLKIQNISHSHEATQSGLWSNRVHFCRGHMREYTADAPLFGRITGRFWIPPHVRGDKNKGLIVKDYEVSTE